MNIYRKRILTLCQYLDESEQTELTPYTISIGHKSKGEGSVQHNFTDFGPEIPFGKIFPEDWIQRNGMWGLKTKPNTVFFACVLSFFNLEFEEYFHTFCPYLQDLEKYGGQIIFHENVCPEDIAFNLKEILERKI